MADRASCSKWIVETARFCAFASLPPGRSLANTILSSRSLTRFASRSSRFRRYVLPCIQMARLAPSTPLGRSISLASICAYVCAQPLGHPRRRGCPSLEFEQLQNSLLQPALRSGASSHHAHRRLRHVLLGSPRLSAGLLFVFPCRRPQGTALPACDRAAVGQLSGPRLRLENDSRQRR